MRRLCGSRPHHLLVLAILQTSRAPKHGYDWSRTNRVRYDFRMMMRTAITQTKVDVSNRTQPRTMKGAVTQLWYYGNCALFLGACFMPMVLPFLLIGAVYLGFWWCRIVVLVLLVDYLVPLRPGLGGYWHSFNQFCNIPRGDRYYHNAEIIVEGGETYDMSKNYCVCSVPHGLYGFGVFLLREYFDQTHGARFLFSGATVIFQTPLLRRLMTWWGCTQVSYTKVVEYLRLPYPNNIFMIMPDGVAGMFYSSQEHEQILLNKRRGFCRVALQTGACLVPCYVLGANQMYHLQVGPDSVAAKFSSKLRLSMVYWTGRWGVPFGFIPYPTKLVIVCGPPIDACEQQSPVDDPTTEQVDALHAKFVHELKAVYNRHKHRMGDEWAKQHDQLYLETEHPPPVVVEVGSKKIN